MNQIKIGKFIAECRKEKNLTQIQLAEKLNITDKAISKWETGKGMPDSSIMLLLCNELGINVNELLSGERLDNSNEYEEKVNQNIVSIAKESEKNRRSKNRIIIIFTILFSIFIIGIIGITIYESTEINIDYDERLIKCEITDDNIFCSFEGISLVNLEHTEVNTEQETLVFITGKMLIQNKIHSHFESWDSMAQLNSNNKAHFSSSISIAKKDIENCKDKIKVYYTNISLNKIKNASQDNLQEIIKGSYLMTEN